MDIATFLILIGFATFCFTAVYWMKSFEKKHRLNKTRRVDYFIQKNKLNVDKFFSGYEYDLIHDTKTESVWFFVLKDDRLRYKQIPFEQIYRVEYKLDGITAKSINRKGPSKRELVGGDEVKSDREFQSFIHLKDDINKDNIKAAKEIKLKIFLDDLQASTLDVGFAYYYMPKKLDRLKRNEALDWFQTFKEIVTTEKRKRA